MKEKLLVYSPSKDFRTRKGACQYYRIEVPTRGLWEQELALIFVDDGKYPEEFSLQNLFSSDIFLLFALAGTNMHAILDQIKQINPGYALDGVSMRYPPTTVFDIDDNLDWVHPFNPSYCIFGIRAPDGTLLNEGDSVCVKLDNGVEFALWKDKESTGDHKELFDIMKNKEFVRDLHSIVPKCDGATFPSKYLGKWYEENWGVKNWHYFPNSVIPDDYPQVKLFPHEGVRISWQGGYSHAPDWQPIIDPLVRTIHKHTETKFILFGTKFHKFEDEIPSSQYEYWKWVNYDGYRATRVLIDADINLCPLIDNMFNRCKSGIKFYEASILHRPEATLAASVPPYSDEIVDGETGLLYKDAKEFSDKLSALIENKELRLRLAENAKKWVLANRSAEVTVPKLLEYYKELKERQVAKWEGTKVVSVGA